MSARSGGGGGGGGDSTGPELELTPQFFVARVVISMKRSYASQANALKNVLSITEADIRKSRVLLLPACLLARCHSCAVLLCAVLRTRPSVLPVSSDSFVFHVR